MITKRILEHIKEVSDFELFKYLNYRADSQTNLDTQVFY